MIFENNLIYYIIERSSTTVFVRATIAFPSSPQRFIIPSKQAALGDYAWSSRSTHHIPWTQTGTIWLTVVSQSTIQRPIQSFGEGR